MYIHIIYVDVYHIYISICTVLMFEEPPKRCKRSHYFGVSHLTASQANTKLSTFPN